MNLDKLDAAIAFIEANPDRHDQTFWFQEAECGTAMCLAGVIVWQAGWYPIWGAGEMDLKTEATVVEKDGLRRRVPDLAREMLSPRSGWERALIDGMFSVGSALADIKHYRNDYANRAGEAGERSDTPKASDLGGGR